MEKEKPLPWSAFVGVFLTMLSLVVAFVLNVTVLGQSVRANTALPPYGRELLQPAANVTALVLLILGIVMMYIGFKKIK